MKNKQNLHSRHASVESKGFTLIELSLVIVVIGLVVGGVVSAKNMIESFKFRKLMAQIEQFKTATVTFENKYDALPGDMRNATSFFTADPSCSAQGFRSALTSPNGMTCNGNGDGMANMAGVNYGSEWHLFWQQLSLAGLLAE